MQPRHGTKAAPDCRRTVLGQRLMDPFPANMLRHKMRVPSLEVQATTPHIFLSRPTAFPGSTPEPDLWYASCHASACHLQPFPLPRNMFNHSVGLTGSFDRESGNLCSLLSLRYNWLLYEIFRVRDRHETLLLFPATFSRGP